MLASAAGHFKDRRIYATGGNDNTVGIWDLTEFSMNQDEVPPISNGTAPPSLQEKRCTNNADELVNALAKFVAFKTISASPKFNGECNQGAAFLRRHCNYLGAKTKLLTTGDDTNPIVHARFNATSPEKTDKTVLFYGHYDVVGADTNRPKWKTDPYQLTSINGFLYGRGVSDNKGPILAALYAAADLARTKDLRCNVVFLIEGEEESGSQNFHETVRQHKDQIGPVNWILLANSYWLDDSNPCLTYGQRGVVHANLIVTSDHPDLHSGIDGSALLDEPLKDLSMLVNTLIAPKGRITLPNFYDPVLPPTEAEKHRYAAIADILLPRHPEIADPEALVTSLMHRWREPSLTIHSIEVPGSSKSATTTISRKAKASLSIRIVPNQDADEVAANLTAFAQEQFDNLESGNDLTVEITGKSDAWLGDPDNEIFETLADAITTAWTPDTHATKHHYPPIASSPSLSLSPGPVSPTSSTPGVTGDNAAAASRPELLRKDSSDSLASHIDRIIMSTSSSARKNTIRKRSAVGTTVPTSSTLTSKSTTGTGTVTGNATSSSSSSGDTPEPDTPSKTVNEGSTHISPEPLPEPRPSDSQTGKNLVSPSRTGVRPIYIREGGSIPTIRFLEKEFSAPAANLPCGQASDNAHLDNERLRVENLYKSREILRYVFGRLPEKARE